MRLELGKTSGADVIGCLPAHYVTRTLCLLTLSRSTSKECNETRMPSMVVVRVNRTMGWQQKTDEKIGCNYCRGGEQYSIEGLPWKITIGNTITKFKTNFEIDAVYTSI